MRGHDRIHTPIAEAEYAIHHDLLSFIKNAGLAAFLDVTLKLFLRDGWLLGHIDVENLDAKIC